MTTISSSAIATMQAKRFSAHAQGNMRRRGGGPGFGGGRTSLYKQMYGDGARNGVKKEFFIYRRNDEIFHFSRKSISMNNLFMHVKTEIIIQLIEFLQKIENLILM